MQAVSKKTIGVICILSMVLFSGCTNWKKKYQNLNVKYQNTLGLLEREQAQKGLIQQASQKTIDELQREIEELKRSPGEVTKFGKGYDVSLDPQAGTITVTLETAILFDSGKAALKRTTELNHIASVLQSEYSGRQIDVVGHTDTDPIKKSDWKDNWELSSQRALTVVRHLIGRGIPADRIRASGCGEFRPRASNSTATGKAKNRRVEVVVYMR